MEVVNIGTKFNSWTVLEEISIDVRKDRNEREFRCRCDCGYEDNVNYKNLKYGKSKACRRCRLEKSSKACTKSWEVIECEDYYLIPMTNKENVFAKIDKEDLPKIIDYTWYIGNVGYATNGKVGLMHRLINSTDSDLCTDHINGDKLDNQKNNLRSISRSEHIKHHIDHIRSFDSYDRKKRGSALSKEQITKIKNLRDIGCTYGDIARMVNSNYATVYNVINKNLISFEDCE